MQLSIEGIAVDYFPNSVDSDSNDKKSDIHSYLSGDNEQYACDLYSHMFYLLKNT